MSATSTVNPAPWPEFALLGLLALLWGSSYLLIKVAVGTIPPLTLIAIRVSVATVFLFAVMAAAGAKLPREAGPWRLLFLQSMLNSIAPWTLLAWGQQYVDSALAGVLNSTSPIFVFFITLLWTRHEPVTARKLGGALCGVLGVASIVGFDALRGLGAQSGAQLDSQLTGQLAVLASALLYAFAAIFGKQLSTLPPVVSAAGTMLLATLVLVPASVAIDRPWTLHPSAASLAAAVALGLLCTGCALLLYFRLVRTLGSMGVTSQSYLRAGVGVLLGIVVLGEPVTASIAIGLAAVIAGVALINLPQRAPR